MSRSTKKPDLTGQRFKRLTAPGPAENSGRGLAAPEASAAGGHLLQGPALPPGRLPPLRGQVKARKQAEETPRVCFPREFAGASSQEAAADSKPPITEREEDLT